MVLIYYITVDNEIVVNRNFNIFFLLCSWLSCSPTVHGDPWFGNGYYFFVFGTIPLGGSGYLNCLAVSMLCLRFSFRLLV